MRYVLATDGSDGSQKAASWMMSRLAHGPDDELFLLYVFPLPADRELVELGGFPTDAGDERVQRIGRRVFDATRSSLGGFAGVVHEILLVGNPAAEIVQFACLQHADLVVTGSRGRTPRAELYLGSVANAVVHRFLGPVLIVPS